VGGLAESHAPGAIVGSTFQALIARQFHALRAGDRFFWQNEAFSEQAAFMISNSTLADIIKRNTNTPDLQKKCLYRCASSDTYQTTGGTTFRDKYARTKEATFHK
jgi:hypothetical protein